MKTIFEVGAHKGGDTAIWLSDKENIVYSFEPVPTYIKKLKKQFKNNKNFHLIETAVDTSEEQRIFNISKGCSSLHEFSDNLTEIWPDRHDWKVADKIIVFTIRLDTFIKQNDIQKIDYLWVDAQGNDFNVLKSLGSYINIVQEGRCEAAYNISLYKNTINDVDTIVAWLTKNNFECTVVPDQWNKEADIHFKKSQAAI
jgi:FkbM family methyltransferase